MRTLLILLLLCLPLAAQPQGSPTPTPTSVETVATPEIPEAASTPEPTPEATPDDPLAQVSRAVGLPFYQTRDDSKAEVRGPFSGRYLLTLSGAEGFTAQARAEKIVNRLKHIAESQGRQASLVGTLRYGDNVVTLTADEQPIATVTLEDLDVIDPRSLPPEQRLALAMDLAEHWQVKLQRELNYAAYTKRPEYLRMAVPLAAILIILALFIQAKLKQIKIRRLGTSVWGLEVLIWGAVVVFNLWLFPATKELARTIHNLLIEPFFRVWMVVFVASVASNILEGIIHGYVTMLRSQPDVQPRRSQRLETLGSVACKTVRATFVVIILVCLVAMLPFDFTPLLTSAGVVGIALGLAAQDLLKDLFAGVAILIEDRFGVGDWIQWSTYDGMVESVNLRNTCIRTIQGGLVTVPNADLRVVNNLSNRWAQVDFQVTVAYRTDLAKALKVLQEEAFKLAADLSDDILEEPVMKGVQKLGDHGVTLRLFLKTRPLLQWDVERELNRRVKLRFDREKIEIPYPQTAVWLRQPDNPEKPKKKVKV